MATDFPLPQVSDQEAGDPWHVEQEPTTLIAFWHGSDAPTQIEVLAGLQQHFGVALEQIDELSGTMWNGVFRTPVSDAPAIIWCEPAAPVQPGDLNLANAEAAKWVIGIETMLTAPDWIDQYAAWLRALAAGLQINTILDPATHRYWQKEQLADLTSAAPAELSEDDLWTIHAVFADGGKTQSDHWIHTHGLWRCGRPELEMLEVPHEHGKHAAQLLNEVAKFVLYNGLPAPGQAFSVGPGLELSAHHWREIAPHVSPQNSGGFDDRNLDDDPHAGSRAVLCGPKPRGVFRKLWMWPDQAVRFLKENDAVVFRTSQQSEREARLARAHWQDLAMAFATASSKLGGMGQDAGTCVFLIKSPIGDAEAPEHVWFQVMRFHGDTAEGRLVSTPMGRQDLKHGEVATLSRSSISGWTAITPHGQFSPSSAPALWRALKRIRGANE